MKAVIFAGGVGTRLWPLSRKKSPKQFEQIIGSQSTLQLAAQRLQPDFAWKDIYVSTGQAYTDIIAQQLPKLPKENIIGEPVMRDVGPAVGLITAILMQNRAEEPIVILWSDHLVRNDKLFRQLLRTAGEVVAEQSDKIIFIAQKPRFASQNLGWIEFGDLAFTHNRVHFHKFKKFKYRPDAQTAKQFFESGHFAWNLGYFVTTPKFLWELYKKWAPDLFQKLCRIQKTYGSRKFASTLQKVYPEVETISFDNAILEKIDHKDALVISENIGWSDIGAWEALKEALQEKPEQNVTLGKVMLLDTIDSLVYNYTDQAVVAIDLKQYLIINTSDVLLVCHKDSVPKIKKFVESLNGTKDEHLT